MPDPLEDFAYRAIGAENRHRIDQTMAETLRAFAVRGVDALVLGGPVTAGWLYSPGEVRGYTDCDLLAAPDRFVTAGRVLRELGFHSHGDEAAHPEVWEEGRRQVWHRLPDDVWVELQWRLPGVGLAPGVAWEVLWSTRAHMQIAGTTVAVGAEPVRAMHLALTAAATPESRKAQLDLERGVRDVAESVWRQAAALAYQLDARTRMAEGLATVPGGAALARTLGLS